VYWYKKKEKRLKKERPLRFIIRPWWRLNDKR